MCAGWPRCSCRVSELSGACCGDDGSDWDSTRYQTHCSSGLGFSCLAWKPCNGSHLPRLAQRHGGGGWLHCSCGWSSVGLGHLPGDFLWGAVKFSGEPYSIESSHVGGGSCALCYSCHDFQYPVYLLGTFWGWLMGPHGSLSLRGGTGCPAPHWNDGTMILYTNLCAGAQLAISHG